MLRLSISTSLLVLLTAGCASGPDSRHTFQSPDAPPSKFSDVAVGAEAQRPVPPADAPPGTPPMLAVQPSPAAPVEKKSKPLKSPAPAVPVDVAPVEVERAPDKTISIRAARVLNGRVSIVNLAAGVCVVNCPIGQLPAVGQTLTVYRGGLRVGEIKITGPARDDNIAAEILSGKIQTDDETRDR